MICCGWDQHLLPLSGRGEDAPLLHAPQCIQTGLPHSAPVGQEESEWGGVPVLYYSLAAGLPHTGEGTFGVLPLKTAGAPRVGVAVDPPGVPSLAGWGEFCHPRVPAVSALPWGCPQANAEIAVQTMLRKFATRHGHVERPLQVEAKDSMDDGTPICLRVTVDPQEVSVLRNPGAGRGLRDCLLPTARP